MATTSTSAGAATTASTGAAAADNSTNAADGQSSSAAATSTTAASNVMSKTTVCLPIVYGSIAFYLGKKADEFSTHQWTLYIRGPNHEDLSVVISKVIFQLHPSFAQPIRELTAPPFEVTECGWGEFEAQIRIIWKDPEEKPTVVRSHIVSDRWFTSFSVLSVDDHILVWYKNFPGLFKLIFLFLYPLLITLPCSTFNIHIGKSWD